MYERELVWIKKSYHDDAIRFVALGLEDLQFSEGYSRTWARPRTHYNLSFLFCYVKALLLTVFYFQNQVQ